MAGIAWIDWRRHAAEATKWREYAFLWIAGLLGGVVGMVGDNTTATLSPEFFLYGKGIALGDGFRWRVTEFGFHAGLVAGVVIGGIFLLANNRKPGRPGLAYLRLIRFALRPIGLAALCIPLIAPLVYFFDPLGIGADFQILLPRPEQMRGFLLVWGTNIAMYTGGLLGTLWGVFGIRRARKRLIELAS
jgi:hypothetical protein